MTRSLKDEGRVDGLTLTTVDETPHHTHFHTIHQSKPALFSTLTQHSLPRDHIAIVPTSLFGDYVTDTLSVDTLTKPHEIVLELNLTHQTIKAPTLSTHPPTV